MMSTATLSRRALFVGLAGTLGGAIWLASSRRTTRKAELVPSAQHCDLTSADGYIRDRTRIAHQRMTPAAYPIRMAEQKRHLVDAEGRPFLIVGDSPWSLLVQVNGEDADLYLEDRQAKGFNTLLVNLIEHKFSGQAPRNFFGESPFMDPNDFRSINHRYFDHAAEMLERAGSRGFLVLLAPAYAGFSGGDEGWYQEMVLSGEEKLRDYGRFLGDRFSKLSNIIWVHGGDFNPPRKSLSQAVADGIREVWPNSLHTVHNGPETNGLGYWSDHEIPLIFDTLYTYQPVAEKAAALNQEKPFILIESRYENERDGTPLRTRIQAWQAMLSGATGQVFGNNPIWHFNAPAVQPRLMDWKSALDSPGAQGIGVLRDFFLSLPWHDLVSDEGKLIVSDPLSGHSRAVAALSRDRKLGVFYLPTPRHLTIDLTQFSGTRFRLQWLDPADGVFLQIAEQTLAVSRSRELHTPECSRDGDWVLLVSSAS